MKLIAALGSPYSRKVRIVLAEKKIEYELIIDSPGDPATKVPQYNPLGKIPVLVLDDVLSELDAGRAAALLGNLPRGQVILTTASALPTESSPAVIPGRGA